MQNAPAFTFSTWYQDWRQGAPWPEWTPERKRKAWLLGGAPWALFPMGLAGVVGLLLFHIGIPMSSGATGAGVVLIGLMGAGVVLGAIGHITLFVLRRRFVWLLAPAYFLSGPIQMLLVR